MSNLSELIPAGGGQNNTDFVADGAITSGKPVILNSAGTASAISETSASRSVPEGSAATILPAVYGQNGAKQIDCAFDVSSNKVVAVFQNPRNSGYLNYIVGDVTAAGAITFGTVTTLVSVNVQGRPSIAADPSNSGTFVISYSAGESDARVAIGTVSGTTLTLGTGVQWVNANETGHVAFDATSSTFVVVYRWASGSPGNSLYANAGTYSGTTITLGSRTQIFSTAVEETSGGGRKLCFDPNTSGKFAVAYRDNASPYEGHALCCTISGTTITAGTAQDFFSTQSNVPDIAFDSQNADTLSIIFQDVVGSNYAAVIPATLSGTVFTFGSKAVVVSSAVEAFRLMAIPTVAGAFEALYALTVSYYETLSTVGFTVGGNVVTAGTSSAIETDPIATTKMAAAMNPADTGGFITIWTHSNDETTFGIFSQAGYTSSNLTSTNLLGIASAAILDTATGTINTWGSRNEVQTSLTIGSDYYVQNDGTITTASSGQLIGTAITATQINIKDYTG